MSNPIEALISNKEVTVIHPYSQSEIRIPTFGGTRLIAEQISYLQENGNSVRVISLGQIGSLTSLLYRFQANLRNKGSQEARNERRNYDHHSEKSRWRLNLAQVLINEYAAKFDVFYRRAINKLIESLGHGSILIYHYPYGARYFASYARKKGIKFLLYQHNIEWKFFEDRLGDDLIQRLLISRAKNIELSAIQSSDLAAFVSDKDRSSVINESRIAKPEMVSWVPIVKKSVKTISSEIPRQIADRIQGKVVVGFVGTNFEPNIVAVQNLVTLARASSDSLVFLVIGSVNRAFEIRNDIPDNILFTGYVQDLDSYLSHCDLFVNPKTTSDTGIETKMFDYLKFYKYVVSTESGARGFSSNKNVIICKIEDMLEKINSLYIIGGNRN